MKGNQMTTTINIKNTSSSEHNVRISATDEPDIFLNEGDEVELTLYEGIEVCIQECLKPETQEEPTNQEGN